MAELSAITIEKLQEQLAYSKWVKANPNDPAQVEWAKARIPRLEAEIAKLEAQPMQLQLAKLETARQDVEHEQVKARVRRAKDGTLTVGYPP